MTDSEDHEAECKILQAINTSARQSSSRPDIPTEAIRALGRICLNRKNSMSVKGKEPEWVRGPVLRMNLADTVVGLSSFT